MNDMVKLGGSLDEASKEQEQCLIHVSTPRALYICKSLLTVRMNEGGQ